MGELAKRLPKRPEFFLDPRLLLLWLILSCDSKKGKQKFRQEDCRAQAAHFSRLKFQRRYLEVLKKAWVSGNRNPDDLVSVLR